MNEKRTGKCLRQIINGEIKQTQLGITCIASIQYHTQYISINIHSTIYEHDYKISIFLGNKFRQTKGRQKMQNVSFKKNLTYILFSLFYCKPSFQNA